MKKNKKVVDAQPEVVATLVQPTPATAAISQEGTNMTEQHTNGAGLTLTLKGLDKSGRNAIYLGAAIALRLGVSAFPEKTPPATIQVEGLAGPKAKRQPLTPEQKEAARLARKNAPKPTAAEALALHQKRSAAREARLVKQAQKEAAAAQAAAEAPAPAAM